MHFISDHIVIRNFWSLYDYNIHLKLKHLDESDHADDVKFFMRQ